MPYAGFWRRAAAYLIDLGLLAMLYALIFGMAMEPDLALHAQIAAVYGVVVAWLYFAGMESSDRQGTLGKMALGLRVTDTQGRPIGFGRATGRHFAKVLSALILYLGFVMVAFTARRQGLHDKLAGTLVLRTRGVAAEPAPAPAMEPPARRRC
jgi:uncharacterized RDD family membrane protein YckC